MSFERNDYLAWYMPRILAGNLRLSWLQAGERLHEGLGRLTAML